ncbi:MAG: hypothetical protein GX220_06445 [Treponema sp.]|nr:hypothetical protein [Treponema sp.]
MNDIRKFYADVQRIVKYDRSNHGGNYDGMRSSRAVADLFVKESADMKNVALDLADFWFEKYIMTSNEKQNEPTDSHVDWLAGVLSFFDGQDDYAEAVPQEDWKEVCNAIKYEAQDIPLELLSTMMNLLLEKGVF